MKGIHRFGLRFALVVAFVALAGGCSVWVLGVVQSFGSQSGPKISTIAGNGTAGYSGDNVLATSTELNQPYGVAIDSSGNLFIADSKNNRVRMVAPSGNITTIASGLNGPVGVAVDSSTGYIYFSDTSNFVVRKYDPSIPSVTIFAGNVGAPGIIGDGGPALSANLDYPYGLAVGSGYLYIAQMGFSSVVRKVDLLTNTISRVAGTGSPGFTGDGGAAISANLNYPQGVAVDSSGNLYIADSSNYVIRKVTPGGTISTIVGTGINGNSGDGGPAIAAQINWPNGVTVDAGGNLYISGGDNTVRKVDVSTKLISTVAGNVHLAAGYGGDGNVATAATLNAPWGLAFDLFGNLLIGDRVNNRIRKVALGQ